MSERVGCAPFECVVRLPEEALSPLLAQFGCITFQGHLPRQTRQGIDDKQAAEPCLDCIRPIGP